MATTAEIANLLDQIRVQMEENGKVLRSIKWHLKHKKKEKDK